MAGRAELQRNRNDQETWDPGGDWGYEEDWESEEVWAAEEEYRWMLERTTERKYAEKVGRLQRQIAGAISIVAMCLLLLSLAGWRGTRQEIVDRFHETEATGQAITPSATIVASPTMTVGGGLAPTAPLASSAAVTPTATTAPAGIKPSTPSQEAFTFAAGQHFATLALLTATAILFPWVLLLAYACQRFPRQRMDMAGDLGRLGLYDRVASTMTVREKQRARDPNVTREQARAENMRLLGEPGLWGEREEDPSSNKLKDLKEAQLGSNRTSSLTKKIADLVPGFLEYLLPLLSVTLVVLASFVWVFWPKSAFGFVAEINASHSLHGYFASVVRPMVPAAVAVVTAYLFIVFQLVRRYHRSDILPGAYWSMFRRLLVAFLLGLVVSTLSEIEWPGVESALNWLAVFLGITAGLLPAATIETLIMIGQAWAEKWLTQQELETEALDLAQRLRQKHPLSLLDDLDQWDQWRFREEGIVGIQGMAKADIEQMLMRTTFPTRQIVDWVDQAILFLTAGAEPTARFDTVFRKLGLRGASDLIDATRTAVGKRKVVTAAQAVQEEAAEDPLVLAQLAALRAQLEVKEGQEKAGQAKDELKEKDENAALEPAARTTITSAVAAVRGAKALANEAVKRVKAGGDALSAALDAANSLQAKLKTASEKADKVEKALESAQDKVTQDLKDKTSAVADVLTGAPDACSQAEALVGALDKIAKPLAKTEAKAGEFKEKAEAIKEKSKSTQDDVPEEIEEAETLFNNLIELAQDAQKQIKADSTLAEVFEAVDELVKLLSDEGEDKPKKLLGDKKLKKKDQWITAGSEGKAKSHSDAEKLAEKAAEILEQVQASAKAVEDARAATTGTAVGPPLTMEVLDTILEGLERNANLRRVQRYLTEETAGVKAPRRYTSNVEWLNGTPTPASELRALPGMDEVALGELRRVGVTTFCALLLKGQTRQERARLQQNTAISHNDLLRWINLCDLMRVPGVTVPLASLLEKAGVDTVPELAQRRAETLRVKLIETNEKKHIVEQGKLPKRSQVESWIEEAGKLARKVTY